MGCQVANTEQLNAGPGIDFKQIGWGSLTSTIFNRLHVFPFFGCSVLRDLLHSTTNRYKQYRIVGGCLGLCVSSSILLLAKEVVLNHLNRRSFCRF